MKYPAQPTNVGEIPQLRSSAQDPAHTRRNPPSPRRNAVNGTEAAAPVLCTLRPARPCPRATARADAASALRHPPRGPSAQPRRRHDRRRLGLPRGAAEPGARSGRDRRAPPG
jgi:hypothetical protein